MKKGRDEAKKREGERGEKDERINEDMLTGGKGRHSYEAQLKIGHP